MSNIGNIHGIRQINKTIVKREKKVEAPENFKVDTLEKDEFLAKTPEIMFVSGADVFGKDEKEAKKLSSTQKKLASDLIIELEDIYENLLKGTWNKNTVLNVREKLANIPYVDKQHALIQQILIRIHVELAKYEKFIETTKT